MCHKPWAWHLMGRQICVGLEILGTRMPYKNAAGCCRSVGAARACEGPGQVGWPTAPHAWQAVRPEGHRVPSLR